MAYPCKHILTYRRGEFWRDSRRKKEASSSISQFSEEETESKVNQNRSQVLLQVIAQLQERWIDGLLDRTGLPMCYCKIHVFLFPCDFWELSTCRILALYSKSPR